MAALKRNALLKELSRKLKDQAIHQSDGAFRTIPETSGVGGSKTRRKNHILYERAGNLSETFVPNTDQ